MRWARRVGAGLAWALVGLLALVASVLYHAQLPLTGIVAIETATTALNREIAGELTIGEIQSVSFDKVVARDVRVLDPQGREVIAVSRIAAWPDWGALTSGIVRVSRVRARGGVVTLFVAGPDEDTVSLVEAFQPVERGGPPGNPPVVVVNDIVLDDVIVRGDVPEFAGLRMEGLRVRGRVDAQRDVRFSVWEANGVMTGPYPGRTHLDEIVGYFDSDLENEGLEFYARAHRGDDRVRARIRLRRPDPNAPPELELRVRAEPVRLETLHEMEVAPGLENLTGTVRGSATLSGRADDLELRADLHSEAGRVQVRGRLPTQGTLRIEADTDRLRLDQLLVRGPAMVVAGRARIELDEPAADGAQARRIHAELQPTVLGDVAIPAFELDGLLEDDALRIAGLRATHAGGESHARGRVGFDGSLDVHVSARLPDVGADPNVRRAAPGARGALTAELDVRADAGAENLRFDGLVSLRGLRYGSVRADSLTLRGSGGGSLPTPQLDLRGQAEALRVGALGFGHAEVTVRGGPGGYELEAWSLDPSGRRLATHGRATVQGDTWRLLLDRIDADLGDGPWTGHADLRITPGRELRLESVALAREHERIAVTGTYRFRGPDEVDAQLLNVDLEHLRTLAPELSDLDGIVDGELALRGDLDRRPQGRLRAQVRDGAFGELRGVDGRVALELDGDALTTDVELDLGEAGTLVAEGLVHVPPAALRDPERLLDEARLDGLRVGAADLDPSSLLAVLGVDELPLTGRVTTDAELTGPLGRPGVRDAVLVLDQIRLEGWPILRAKLRLSFENDVLAVRHAWVADPAGELATGEADLPLPADALPSDLTSLWQLLRARPWSVSLRIPERRLDTLPETLLENVPRGLSASASVTAGNRDGALRAELDAAARWVEAAVDDPCAAELRPRVILRGTVENELASLNVTGSFGADRPELSAQAIAVLPFDEWVRHGDVSDVPPTELVARLRGADLGDIPWLCGYGRGPVSASLTAKNLLTGRSVIGAVVDLPELRVWESVGDRSEPQLSEAYRVHARAGSSPERDALTACAILGLAGEDGTPGAECREVSTPAIGELVSRARVPVRWVEGQLLPEYVDGSTIASWTRLREVHVAPVLTLIPGIVTGDAVMDGEVRVRGPWEGLRLEGAIELADGHLQIEGLGQHLHDIEGHVDLRGDEAIFPSDRPLSARDAGGLATAYGRVGFQGIVPREVNLNVRASEFPIRREGMVLAWLTGAASVEGDIGDDETRSTIRIRPPDVSSQFEVRLPDAAAGNLQPLGAHPEILVIGEERPPEPSEIEASYAVHVNIDASDRFWVRRNDFAAQVTANLQATYRDPNLYVGGEATVWRGTFEIFGKRFELQQSTMTFDPSSPDLDPMVSFTAVYEVPGRRGVTVTVEVTGTLSEPQLEFRSTETNDRAEIIALLLSGGRRESGTAERQATEQAASFLAGLTAGILTLGLREEFGSVIPVRLFAIESESFGVTRLRVGIDANDLIPDVLRGVVLDAYIEGFVTAAADNVGTTAGPGGIGGGVTLEFTLPSGFLLRGTYVPVDHGSVDFLFEPR